MSEDSRTGSKLLIRKTFVIAGKNYAADLYKGKHPTLSPSDVVIVDESKDGYNLLVLEKGVVPPTLVSVITPPVQFVNAGQTVTLDGSKSIGTIVSYKWSQVSGPPISFKNAAASVTTFLEPNTLQDITVELIVADANTHTATSQAVIHANILPPAVQAVITPASQMVVSGTTVTLDGSKSIGAVSFQWKQTSGTPVNLLNATTSKATFTAPTETVATAFVFSLTVAGQAGATDTTSTTVTVNPIPPVDKLTVADVSASTQPGQAVDVALSATDSDPTATSITLQLATQPAHGTAHIVLQQPSKTRPHGLIASVGARYTPVAGFSGTDSFTYKATDDKGNISKPGTVTVTVGSGPPPPPSLTVSNATTTTAENTSADIPLTATDSISGASVVFAVLTQPADGTAIATTHGVSYTPNTNFNGSDSLTFNASDDHGQTSNTGTVSITVTSQTGGVDVFGVKKVYGDWTATPASNWTMSNDPNNDPRANNPEASSSFKPKFIKNADGSFKIQGQLEIRGAITQNNGYHENQLCTNFTTDRKNGFMQDNMDWGAGQVGLEMTGFYRINQAGTGSSNGESHIEHVMKGQRSTTSSSPVGPCGDALGCSDNYHCNIYNNKGSNGPARQKFEKDLFHTTGYSSDVNGVNNNSAYNFVKGQFQGFKTIVYLVPNGSGGNNAVLEHWTNENGDLVTWKKTHSFTDTGANWPPRGSIGNCTLPPSPSGSPVIDFGGPLTVFRSDNIQDYDVKFLSIRSINPSVKLMGAEHSRNATTNDPAHPEDVIMKRTKYLDGHEEIKPE